MEEDYEFLIKAKLSYDLGGDACAHGDEPQESPIQNLKIFAAEKDDRGQAQEITHLLTCEQLDSLYECLEEENHGHYENLAADEYNDLSEER